MDGARPLPAPMGTELGRAASGGGPMVGSSLPGLLGALQTAHGPSGACRACTERPLARATQSWRRESRSDPATSAASRSARWWRQRFKEEPAAGATTGCGARSLPGWASLRCLRRAFVPGTVHPVGGAGPLRGCGRHDPRCQSRKEGRGQVSPGQHAGFSLPLGPQGAQG